MITPFPYRLTREEREQIKRAHEPKSTDPKDYPGQDVFKEDKS